MDDLTVDELLAKIGKLKEDGTVWGDSLEHQRQIKEIANLIGAHIVDPADVEWLRRGLHKATGAPLSVLRDLIKEAAFQEMQRELAEKPPQRPRLPDGCIEADERPVDLQAAELIHEEHERLVAERSSTLFRYAKDQGFWGIWPDTKAKKAAQSVYRRLGVYKLDVGWQFIFGSAVEVKACVEQLKVLTTDGPLSSNNPPAVIVFRNGTYNLKTNQLEEHNPNHGATYGVAADYVHNSDCPPELKKVIETCYPEGALAIIRVIIRWAVDPTIRYGEAFHVVGASGTGKGLLIDFIRSLFPPSVVGQLPHPAHLSSPEKIHQYVVGRRLVAFPDTPATNEGCCNIFYELVENKPVTTR